MVINDLVGLIYHLASGERGFLAFLQLFRANNEAVVC